MAKTDGEYELVLGNRQLLSAFFIVVILFALFFTMGYIVGRNSAPSTMASIVAPSARPPATPTSAAPPAVETATESPKPEAVDPAFAYDRPLVPPTTHPVTETPEKAAPEKKAVVEKKMPEKKTAAEKRAEKKAAAREVAPAPAPTPIEPRPGQTFLQVVAVAQPQAGAVVDTLKAKGFPAKLIPGPNATIFRVVVGPYGDAASLGKAKAELENAGFRPIMRR
jgi:outer membrane biosynthesis protein TonB